MSSLPTCTQCGGREFFIESGFYFCAECQIQSQDIHEQLLAEIQGGVQTRTTVVQSEANITDTEQLETEGHELTSWEVLNYVLKGWIDELIRLGVDAKIKIVALQLWVAYLQKLEVAFTSTVVEKKPRLGFTFRPRDAELVYGTSHVQSKVLRKAFSARNSNSSRTSASSNSSLSFRHIHSKRKRELAKVLYDEESAVSDTSQNQSNVSLENLSVSSPGSTRSTRLRFTDHAKKTITKLFGSLGSLSEVEEREYNYRSAQVSEMKSLRHLSVQSIFALLRLALLICRSPVQLSDMFRWSREGYLSLRNVERLLPSSVCVTRDIKSLLVNPINSWMLITKKVHYLAGFLDVQNINVDIASICCKLAQQLHLPEDINKVVQQLVSISRPRSLLSASVNYEGRAVAFIIFILKLIFSLDGSTELANSEAARKINKWMDKTGSEEGRLFVWTEWTEAVELRDAVIAGDHVPTRELWYQGVHLSDSSQAFIGQWQMAPKQQTVDRRQVVKTNVGSVLERLLDPLSSDGRVPLKPSLTPSSSLIQEVSVDLTADIASKLSNLLTSTSCTSLSAYFNFIRLSELAEESGCQLCHGALSEFRLVQKYRNTKFKPRSKTLQNMVSVDLIGELSSSDWSESESTEDLSSKEWTDNSVTDDSDYSPPRRKSKRIKSIEKVKRKFKTSSKKMSWKSSYRSETSPSNKPSFSNMEVLPTPSGSVAVKIDLNNTLSHCENLLSTNKCSLYIPKNYYWRLDGSFYMDGITVEEFEEYARTSFSPSFLWLLKRCSVLIDQSMRDVYKQLTVLESVYFNVRRKRRCYRKKW